MNTLENPCNPANAWIYGPIIALIGVTGWGLWWLARRAWSWWQGKPSLLSRHTQLITDMRRETQAILDGMDARAARHAAARRRREEAS